MKLIILFLTRKALVLTLSLISMGLGLIALYFLPIQLYPSSSENSILVNSFYSGASAELMDETVAAVIIPNLMDINGVDYITSKSAINKNQIVLNLKPNTDVKSIESDVARIVNSIPNLPSDMDPPLVSTSEQDKAPDIAIAFYIESGEMNVEQLSDFITRTIKPKLLSLSGVGSVDVMGNEYSIKIKLDLVKMLAYEITVQDIKETLLNNNLNLNSGVVYNGNTKQIITTNTSLHSVEEFENIKILDSYNDRTIKLSEIASISIEGKEKTAKSFFGSDPAVMVSITWSENSNPLETSKQLFNFLEKNSQIYSSGIKHAVVIDGANFISDSMHEIFVTLICTFVAVAIIIIVGTGSFKLTLLPLAALPLSLLSAFIGCYLLGFSLNMLTMLAIVLAVGLVVDDAIIVMDALLHTKKQHGFLDNTLVLETIKRILGSIITMTLSVSVVYLPLLWIGGIAGSLFKEFVIMLAMTVILSGIFSILITPFMFLFFSKNYSYQDKLIRKIDSAYLKLKLVYKKLLFLSFKFNKLIIYIWGGIILLILIIFHSLPSELAPEEDRGYLMVLAETNTSTRGEYTFEKSKMIVDAYNELPYVKNYNYVVGTPQENQIMSFVRLEDWHKRDLSAMELRNQLQNNLSQNSELQSVVILPSSIPGVSGIPFQIVLIQNDDNYDVLDKLSTVILQKMRQSSLFQFVRKDLAYDMPEIDFVINKELMNEYKVSPYSIANTISSLFSNKKIQSFYLNGKPYDVIFEADRSLSGEEQIKLLQVRNLSGDLIDLDLMLNAKYQNVLRDINRFQGQASVKLQGVLSKGTRLSDAISLTNEILKDINPRGVSLELVGETRYAQQENQNLLMAISMAILCLFIIAVLQFSHFKDSFIIIFGSIPFAIFGASLCLFTFDFSLNLYTQIGLLTLTGLIVKQSLFMIKEVRLHITEEKNNFSYYRGIINGSVIRLRAIILTGMTMLLGTLPLLFAQGPMSVSRFELGMVIFSGIVLGTILTLFFLPNLFLWINNKRS